MSDQTQDQRDRAIEAVRRASPLGVSFSLRDARRIVDAIGALPMPITDEMVRRAEWHRVEARRVNADLWPDCSVEMYRLAAMRAALEAALREPR